jgi:hypothetical protein
VLEVEPHLREHVKVLRAIRGGLRADDVVGRGDKDSDACLRNGCPARVVSEVVVAAGSVGDEGDVEGPMTCDQRDGDLASESEGVDSTGWLESLRVTLDAEASVELGQGLCEALEIAGIAIGRDVDVESGAASAARLGSGAANQDVADLVALEDAQDRFAVGVPV